MDVDHQFSLEQLLFMERTCRVCGSTKSLMDDFYLTRKDRNTYLSSYSYECKQCTVKRVLESRKKIGGSTNWCYPDW